MERHTDDARTRPALMASTAVRHERAQRIRDRVRAA